MLGPPGRGHALGEHAVVVAAVVAVTCWLGSTLGDLDVGEVLVAAALWAGVGVGFGCRSSPPVSRLLVEVFHSDPFGYPVWVCGRPLYLRPYMDGLGTYMAVLRGAL